jgi:hypothetical protein
MKSGIALIAVALGLALSACSQGNSDNVMSPEANALAPADVNAALGPEVTNTPDTNVSTNGEAVNETASNKVPNINDEPDEPGTPTNNATE